MKKTNKIITVLIFLFLYAPMIVLMVASFNTGKDVTDFEGFTLSQYAAVFTDRSLLQLGHHVQNDIGQVEGDVGD